MHILLYLCDIDKINSIEYNYICKGSYKFRSFRQMQPG